VRILHVVADLDHRKGGPTAACLGLARMMARRGHHVRIITTNRGFAPETSDRGGVVEIDALPGNWPAFFGTSWAMRRRLAEVIPDVDIVHLHSLYLFHDWATGRECWRLGKPYIVRPHGTLDPFIYRRHRWRKALIEVLFQDAVLRRAAGLHFTAREEWRLARPHALNPRGCIIPIGIDLGPFADLPPRTTLRARYPAIGDRKVVLFLGRLSFKKGVDIAIAAFAKATRGRDDAFLVIAGPDNGVRADAEARIALEGLGEKVLFTGMVSGEDKRVVLSGSDVFLLPSQSENFGIAVVEAAACGIPVVISDQVNLWRDFEDAKAGLTAPPAVDPFATHLRALLDDPSKAARLGQRGAELARRRFNWEALGAEYEEMYALAARDKALPELA
jgi:glycosyltransferase involved in cell wall biosynthesis